MAMKYESECYCTNLRRAAGAVADFYDELLKPSGLTAAQYSLLTNLAKLERANITHWAERVGLERSTLVRNLKPLQERGLVEATEGHGKVFRLSESGQRAIEVAGPLWEQAQAQIENLLGEESLCLRLLLRKLSKTEF